MRPVVAEPMTVVCLIAIFPLISSFCVGLVVPIPTYSDAPNGAN